MVKCIECRNVEMVSPPIHRMTFNGAVAMRYRCPKAEILMSTKDAEIQHDCKGYTPIKNVIKVKEMI